MSYSILYSPGRKSSVVFPVNVLMMLGVFPSYNFPVMGISFPSVSFVSMVVLIMEPTK